MNPLFLLISVVAGTPAWAPEALFDINQFAPVEGLDSKESTYAVCQRRSDGFVFTVRVETADADAFAVQKRMIMKKSAIVAEEPTTGFPVGNRFVLIKERNGFSLRAGYISDAVAVAVLAGLGPDFKVTNRREVWVLDDHIPFVESLAREALAKFASRRLEQPGTVDIDGTRVAGYTAKGSGAVLVDLAAWAKAKGYALNLNAKEFRASVSTPSGAALVCAASPKSKLGDKWVPMPDIAMLKDGKLWAPYAFLKGL